MRRAGAAGFDLVELPLMDPFTFDSAAARRALDDTGLQATASLGLNPAADVSSDDPDVVEAGRRLLSAALDRAAEMGSAYLCGVMYGSMQKHMAPVTASGRASSLAAVADAGPSRPPPSGSGSRSRSSTATSPTC